MRGEGESNPVIVLTAEVIFIILLALVFGGYVIWRGMHPIIPSDDVSEKQELADLNRRIKDQVEKKAEPSPVHDMLTEFYARLAENAPRYGSRSVSCPVDGTPLELPVQQSDNNVGGLASDMMKIAVGPPSGASAAPDLLIQQWEQLPVTCPSCLATFEEQDINNLRWPERLSAMQEHWKLSELCPGLAATPLEDWTPDMVQFDRYLSMREAQQEHIELGFAALGGAYASNFVVWSGEHGYSIPSAAFYALAAAEFQAAIDAGWEGLPERSRVTTALALAECQRLLGRFDDARATLELARGLIDADPGLKPMLALEERYVDEGRDSLEHVNLEELPDPPIGWQLQMMLPAMNGHITQYRADWQDQKDLAGILERIKALTVPAPVPGP